MKNSLGNIIEILELLDKNVYTGEELRENYMLLVNKWGEWEIIGGGAGITVRYIDIANALFSGLMITFCTLTIISLILAIVFGKIVFPLLSKHYSSTNEELVALSTLKSAQQIDTLAKTNGKEWF